MLCVHFVGRMCGGMKRLEPLTFHCPLDVLKFLRLKKGQAEKPVVVLAPFFEAGGRITVRQAYTTRVIHSFVLSVFLFACFSTCIMNIRDPGRRRLTHLPFSFVLYYS